MAKTELAVIRLKHGLGLELPAYQSDAAAGFDLLAACAQEIPVTLAPGERVLIPTGLIFEIPTGHEGQIRPRSGLAHKHGITCLNTPGTIDADYRGEVKVLLINHSDEEFTVKRAMRIAQMVIAPVARIAIVEKNQVSETRRGEGGFGSTGGN